MAYFNPGFIKYFKGLKKNNNKEWFDKNKSIYENEVKKPFERLVGDIILEMQKLHPGFYCEIQDAIFRINRDIRFSNDKTPYKTAVSAAIVHGGRKNMSDPGLYIELSEGNLGIYGGVYMPDKDQLSRIRTAILNHPTQVKRLNSDKNFITFFKSIKGDQNKVLAPEFKQASKTEPLLLNKQYYFNATYKDNKIILGEGLVPFIMKHHKFGRPWSDFLSRAMSV